VTEIDPGSDTGRDGATGARHRHRSALTDTRWLDELGGYVMALGGPVDLFFHRAAAEGAGRRHFLARVEIGALVPPVPPGAVRLEAVPLPGSVLVPAGSDLELPDGLDATLLAVAGAIRAGQGPREAIPLQPRQILSTAAGGAVTGNSHAWWVRLAGGPADRNGGGPGQRFVDGELMLLAGRDWVEFAGGATIESCSTRELLDAGALAGALDAHLRRLLEVLDARIVEGEAQFVQTLRDRKRSNAAFIAQAARTALTAVGASARTTSSTDQAHVLRYRRARALLELTTPGRSGALHEPGDQRIPIPDDRAAFEAVARSSALYLRDIELGERWWRHDVGPLVGWLRDGDGAAPVSVALLHTRRGYLMIDPMSRAESRVDSALASRLAGTATQVHVPLPAEARPRHAMSLSIRGVALDARAMLLAGVLAALVGLAAPLLTGRLLGGLAQGSSTYSLRLLPLLLVTSATVAALAAAAQNLRLLRIEGRLELNTQLAVWDRLLRLPVRFYRSSTTGELANAVLGISFVREALSGLAVQIVGSFLTVVADVVLILLLNPTLGLCSALIVTIAAVTTLVLGALVMRAERRALPSEHRSAAVTNQLLAGITKIKLARAEDRAHLYWTAAASEARARLMPVRRIQATIVAISTGLPVAGQLVLFLLLAGPLRGSVSAGQFFTINAAFTVLLASPLVVVSSSVEVFAAIPRLQVLAPVISAAPEQRSDLADPGDLRGEISLVNVSFSYNTEDEPVIDDLTLHIRPGEFVAIVGPSGCGKSTLLRLLLGFEKPTSGAVLFDGQDLAGLDPQAVRRQLGVVLQDGQLFAGSIRENICGARSFTLNQAWEAARLAGIDVDIDRLPMGMSTLLPPGGGTLSVGQRQRILIARALIHHPRLLLFDEATSALDNRTQEIVTRSTQELAASRIVVAHRLSTVVAADRIVVLEKGRIVQDGSYQQLLLERTGLFYRLAQRQLLTEGP
jgi:NHLM bacteriocin system ABC transporter ATP-binding protein